MRWPSFAYARAIGLRTGRHSPLIQTTLTLPNGTNTESLESNSLAAAAAQDVALINVHECKGIKT
jgi:hypothetical protein